MRSLKRSRISETVTLFGAGIIDGADDAPLGDDERTISRWARVQLQADIVEAAGVPQHHEVAAQRLFVVKIARLGKDERFQKVSWECVGAAEFEGLNHPARRG